MNLKQLTYLILIHAVVLSPAAFAADTEKAAETPPTVTTAHASAPAVTKPGTNSADVEEASDEIELPKSYLHSSSTVSKSKCTIKCIDPHAACEESAKVINIVLEMYKAYSEHDLDTLAKYLDKDCTTFDEGTKKLITGREAVLAEIKDWLQKNSSSTQAPLMAYTIEHPFCQVSNDSAVVTFTALKELGGEHPRKFKSRCTDIFRKDGDSWVRTHYRSHWTEVE